MKSLVTCGALALAVMFAPIAAGSAQAEDAHHPGKAATTKNAPAHATKKVRKARTADASMMSNCQAMQGGQGQPGGMNCPQDRANITGLFHGMMHSMMIGNGMMMDHGKQSRGH